MKLLTLNTHSIIEPSYKEKCEIFCNAIAAEKPDIIALQEVNQIKFSPVARGDVVSSFVPCDSDTPLRRTNHALRIVDMLKKRGVYYNYTWCAVKNGYKKYDEGLAILSLDLINSPHSYFISKSCYYSNWKTRKALWAKTCGVNIICVHTGWWNDEDEPFLYQWQKLCENLPKDEQVFLMGDFNSPADVKNEGYSHILQSGWHDTFTLASKKDDGITVKGKIDGWNNSYDKRIDYIFTNKEINVKSSDVIFNQKNYPEVSDHYGVMITI